jgi:hypothetical protein
VGLIVLSAFWSASEYAKARGTERAQDVASALNKRPEVTVFTAKRLGIDAAGVTEDRLAGGGLAYRYRYAGLRLLAYSKGKYFLLPDGWTHGSDSAIVLADSPGRRFEFTAGECALAAAASAGECESASAAEATADKVSFTDVNTRPDLYGSVRVGRTRELQFSVSGTGDEHVAMSRLSIQGKHAADFRVVGAICSPDVARVPRCEIRISFAPRAAGLRVASAVLDAEAGDIQPLIGRGILASRRRHR